MTWTIFDEFVQFCSVSLLQAEYHPLGMDNSLRRALLSTPKHIAP